MTTAKLTEAVTNARAKVEAGNADHQDETVAALAEAAMSNRQTVLIQRRVLRKLTEGGMVFTCTHCGFSQSDGPLPDDHWRTCERHPAKAERDAMAAENARLRDEITDLRQAMDEMRARSPAFERLDEIAAGLVDIDGRLRSKQDLAITALRDQNARLVALLREDAYTSHDYCTEDPEDVSLEEPCTDDPPCFSHRVLAEIGSA